MFKYSRGLVLIALSLFVSLAPSAAWGSAMVDKVPVTLFTPDNCNGGLVKGEGSLELRQIDTGNGTFLFQYTAHFTGVGTVGGEYVGVMGLRSLGGFGYSYREVLVSKGSAPNETYLLTVGLDQNGNYYSTLEVTCHG